MRERPDESLLGILRHTAEGGGVGGGGLGVGGLGGDEPSCNDDGGSQVDSTGPTAMKMLIIINSTHLIITPSQKSESCSSRPRSPGSSPQCGDCPDLPSRLVLTVRTSWRATSCNVKYCQLNEDGHKYQGQWHSDDYLPLLLKCGCFFPVPFSQGKAGSQSVFSSANPERLHGVSISSNCQLWQQTVLTSGG